MEADFNMHNCIVFGHHMILAAKTEGRIPPEQFSTKNGMAEDGSFQKTLVYGISQ